jgi:transcriptional regulator with XRE-family HTH domain
MVPGMDIRAVIGDNTKRARLRRGLTQEQLAELMGLDRAYISGLEQGRRNPTAVTLWRIAVALEIRPADLLKPPSASPGSRQRKA